MTHIARQKLRANGISQGKFSKVPGRQAHQELNLPQMQRLQKAHNRAGFRAGKFDLVEG
jgi:hypothetical protein